MIRHETIKNTLMKCKSNYCSNQANNNYDQQKLVMTLENISFLFYLLIYEMLACILILFCERFKFNLFY